MVTTRGQARRAAAAAPGADIQETTASPHPVSELENQSRDSEPASNHVTSDAASLASTPSERELSTARRTSALASRQDELDVGNSLVQPGRGSHRIGSSSASPSSSSSSLSESALRQSALRRQADRPTPLPPTLLALIASFFIFVLCFIPLTQPSETNAVSPPCHVHFNPNNLAPCGLKGPVTRLLAPIVRDLSIVLRAEWFEELRQPYSVEIRFPLALLPRTPSNRCSPSWKVQSSSRSNLLAWFKRPDPNYATVGLNVTEIY